MNRESTENRCGSVASTGITDILKLATVHVSPQVLTKLVYKSISYLR